MRLHRAYVYVSRQFSNRCGSSGARNTISRPFVFIVILVIFSSMLLGWKREKNRKMVAVVRGRRSQPRYFQKAKLYEKEFKCCFGMGGREINAEDVFVKDVGGL